MNGKYEQTTKLTIELEDDEIEQLFLLLKQSEAWRSGAVSDEVPIFDELWDIVLSAINRKNGDEW
jgi:hypothetical protein